MRQHIDPLAPEETGWLAGLRDPAIGKALALIHTEPNRDWTADGLAAEVNLSRSAFAEKFSCTVGQPPMKYLTNWRMQVAAHKLRENRNTISQIAFDVGYESEAAFTRAFRREMGAPRYLAEAGDASRSHRSPRGNLEHIVVRDDRQ